MFRSVNGLDATHRVRSHELEGKQDDAQLSAKRRGMRYGETLHACAAAFTWPGVFLVLIMGSVHETGCTLLIYEIRLD